ncbi:MAG: hypothetical protein B7Y12_00710 [Rhizobiales bacterium 24-66-13]|jgi:hypothetical protein|nr:MAG: hypothetical protein B7Y95_04130 [Rhizobiales bacterium 32-66-11]OYY14031.1 MAG: hypothetical protein B7Y70_00190 [Rhizobiales bacterium 35-68-8]OYZ83122.1 MAG: hypothetical protein B7Y12_00710 [Rhizobiales bacterium 24-66-13]OZB12052.1 MAG: hypothetical protein B7X67_01295 [Rhizobiales bacterium 39-66-18]
MTGLRRFIVMLCMAVMSLSSVQFAASGAEDLEHALEIAHSSETLADVVHYCSVSVEACERQPHAGDAHTAPHHHHGDPTPGYVLTAAPAFSVAFAAEDAVWSTESPLGRGLGQHAPERPPKA